MTPEQLKYCANDVIYLHRIHEELNKILIRENRVELYKNCLKFLKTKVELDLAQFKESMNSSFKRKCQINFKMFQSRVKWNNCTFTNHLDKLWIYILAISITALVKRVFIFHFC